MCFSPQVLITQASFALSNGTYNDDSPYYCALRITFVALKQRWEAREIFEIVQLEAYRSTKPAPTQFIRYDEVRSLPLFLCSFGRVITEYEWYRQSRYAINIRAAGAAASLRELTVRQLRKRTVYRRRLASTRLWRRSRRYSNRSVRMSVRLLLNMLLRTD